ncbi:ScbR family autoregulator-binding transcription factor [Streptomyces sp. NPDC051956]|uniref:ScbR family autoregulator-binding transcription factor n=1 Tax=Streptomyces sp. NPDC051956 TaxID=3365677 RepID=UPI0037D1856E
MAQQERAVRTRQAILEAAGEVFADHGYAAATISDVYKRCGVTKGAFYFHFASKAELAQAVLDDQVDDQVRHFEVPPGSQAVKTQDWVDLGLLVAHRLTFDKILQGSVRLAVDIGHDAIDRRVPYRSWVEVNRDVLAKAEAHGELLPDVDVDAVARMVIGAFTGVQMMSEVMSGRGDLEEQAAVLYTHIARSIAVPEVYAQLDFSVDRGKRLMAGVLRERTRTAG